MLHHPAGRVSAFIGLYVCASSTFTAVMIVCVCVFVFSTQAACSTDITVIIPGLDTSFLSAPCKSPDSLRMHQYYAYKNPFLINQPQSSLLSFCLPKKIKVNTVNKDAGLKNPSSRAIFTILCLEYELQQLIILFSKSVRLVSTFPGSL